MKYFQILIGAALISINLAWYTPRTATNLTASQDVLPASTDVHSVGTSGNIWHNGYYKQISLGYTVSNASVSASFGGIFASSDGSVYYKNSAGTITKMDN